MCEFLAPFASEVPRQSHRSLSPCYLAVYVYIAYSYSFWFTLHQSCTNRIHNISQEQNGTFVLSKTSGHCVFHTQANIKCRIFLLQMLLTCNVLVKCMQEIVIIINNVNNIINEPKNKDFIFYCISFSLSLSFCWLKQEKNWPLYK